MSIANEWQMKLSAAETKRDEVYREARKAAVSRAIENNGEREVILFEDDSTLDRDTLAVEQARPGDAALIADPAAYPSERQEDALNRALGWNSLTASPTAAR